MGELDQQRCEACRADTSTLSDNEINELLREIPGWTLIEVAGVKRLTRSFHFHDFQQAIQFNNLVGELAEAENHHPQLVTEWGAATVTWWTHKIDGLHSNDFIMAARTSALY